MQFRRAYNVRGCILRGMRAAEMAAGVLFDKLGRLMALANNILLLDPLVAVLDAVSKAIVVRDFAVARRHVMFVLMVKCGYWTQLPHVLAGLSHVDVTVARACARRALDLAALVVDWDAAHAISKARAAQCILHMFSYQHRCPSWRFGITCCL
jgi:hypothetical protein